MMLLNTKFKKSTIKLILASVASALIFSSCNNKSTEENVTADNETLIVATHGKVMNIKLEQHKIQWQ